VSKAFRLPIEEIFEEFSDKPVASGSIAQVHREILKQKLSPEGKPITVAVKVRHPHVSKIIQRDFTIIKYFAKASMLMSGLKHLQLNKNMHHFASFMTK
jgi:aarF domain-containing kinase